MLRRRLSGVLFLSVLPIFLVSAKCIENDTVRRDGNGDWTIYGEIHNETDVQGVQMLLRGTIFNDSGDVVGVAQAQTCPSELSPGSLSVFAIRFNNSLAVGQPARHQVNVLSGKTLDDPLPIFDATADDLSAVVENGTDLRYGFTVTPNQQYTGRVIACLAWYDAAGEVVFTDAHEVGQSSQQGVPLDFVELTSNYRSLFGEVTSVRFWVWIEDPDSQTLESFTQALVTDHVPVQH